MGRKEKFIDWMQNQNGFVQSIIFTIPAASAVALITGLLWATAYPIEESIQGEVTDLEGQTICADDNNECYTVVNRAIVDTGDQIYVVNLRERFQQTAERDRLETGDIVDITYRSTRDKEFFGANDDIREVYEKNVIVLSPQ